MIPAGEIASETGITGPGTEPLIGIRSEGASETNSLDLCCQHNDYLVVQLQRDINNLIGRINERGWL